MCEDRELWEPEMGQVLQTQASEKASWKFLDYEMRKGTSGKAKPLEKHRGKRGRQKEGPENHSAHMTK